MQAGSNNESGVNQMVVELRARVAEKRVPDRQTEQTLLILSVDSSDHISRVSPLSPQTSVTGSGRRLNRTDEKQDGGHG